MSSDILRSHLRNGEYDLARLGAENALETAAEDDRGVLYAILSRSLQRLGRPRQAMAAAEQAAKRSQHWEVTLAMGEEQGAVKTGDKAALLGIGSGLNCLMMGVEW